MYAWGRNLFHRSTSSISTTSSDLKFIIYIRYRNLLKIADVLKLLSGCAQWTSYGDVKMNYGTAVQEISASYTWPNVANVRRWWWTRGHVLPSRNRCTRDWSIETCRQQRDFSLGLVSYINTCLAFYVPLRKNITPRCSRHFTTLRANIPARISPLHKATCTRLRPWH